MDQPSKFDKIKKILPSIPNYVIAITGIVGLVLVMGQLIQLKNQNKTLERSLSQTYRPLGVARFSWEKPAMVILGYPPMEAKEKDKISFDFELKLKNKGKGLLSYLGSLSYLSQNEIAFRSELLNGEIDSVHFDGMYTYARESPVLPDEIFETYGGWKNIPFKKVYFLYVLFLYKDQDGNLFDTEHLNVLNFQDPISTEKGISAKFDATENNMSYMKETYNTYSMDEKLKLCNFLKAKNHNLSSFICAQ
jgi:hypothetical protein